MAIQYFLETGVHQLATGNLLFGSGKVEISEEESGTIAKVTFQLSKRPFDGMRGAYERGAKQFASEESADRGMVERHFIESMQFPADANEELVWKKQHRRNRAVKKVVIIFPRGQKMLKGCNEAILRQGMIRAVKKLCSSIFMNQSRLSLKFSRN